MRPSTLTAATLAALLFAADTAHAAPATEQLQRLQGQLRQARGNADWPAYLRTAAALQTFVNGAPRSLLEMARGELQAGDAPAALAKLAEFAAMGQAGDLPGLAAEFANLPAGAALEDIQARMTTNASPVTLAVSGLQLADSGLLPEDLDYDRAARRFLITSIRERKIVALSRTGRSSDFARSPDNWPMVALKIDRQRHLVWATEVAFQGSILAPAADWGRSALLCFELSSGRLLRRIEAPRGAALGDMVLTARGEVIVSDGDGGGLYRLASGQAALQVLNGTDLVSPQTAALHPDGRHLFVPDYVRGIAVLDLESGRLHWLSMQGKYALNGIDGLYFDHGRLLAVQNGTLPERVAMFALDATLEKIVGETIVERATATLGDPTHGVVLGREFWYIANSGWDVLDEHGALKVQAHSAPPRLMRFQLPRTS